MSSLLRRVVNKEYQWLCGDFLCILHYDLIFGPVLPNKFDWRLFGDVITIFYDGFAVFFKFKL